MFLKALLYALAASCLASLATAQKYPPVSLANSYYIWTNETTPSKPFAAPLGSRAFRKTIDLASSAPATVGSVVMAVDDEFSLWVNGKYIGNGSLSQGTTTYNFTIDPPTCHIVIAVNATNTIPTNAYLIGDFAFDTARTCDCKGAPPFNVTTDASWKFSLSVPAGFEKPNYDDSAWKNAVVQGHA